MFTQDSNLPPGVTDAMIDRAGGAGQVTPSINDQWEALNERKQNDIYREFGIDECPEMAGMAESVGYSDEEIGRAFRKAWVEYRRAALARINR